MKERLTGAIILVALVVLLVPELLTGPVRSAPRRAVVTSSAEEPPLRSYTINLADDGHGHSAATAAGEAEQPAPLPAPAAEAPGAASGAVPQPPEASSPAASLTPPATPAVTPPSAGSARAPANPPAPAAASGAFVVQLGSFASRANAEHLAQRLRSQGYGVSVSQADGGRHLYRVRVGPARDHDAAQALAQRLRSGGHSGSIVPK